MKAARRGKLVGGSIPEDDPKGRLLVQMPKIGGILGVSCRRIGRCLVKEADQLAMRRVLSLARSTREVALGGVGGW